MNSVIDAIRSMPHVNMPLVVQYDHNISHGARLLYVALLDYAGQDGRQCIPGEPFDVSASELATVNCCTRPTLRKRIKELSKRGLLWVVRSNDGSPNRYRLAPLESVYTDADCQAVEDMIAKWSADES